jgi:hypothetical protein
MYIYLRSYHYQSYNHLSNVPFEISMFLPSGDLLKLLDVSSAENVLPTTYGSLQPPLGKHRLKVSSTCFVYLMILSSHELNTQLVLEKLVI